MKLTCRAPLTLDEPEMARITQAAIRVLRRVPLRAQGTDEFNQCLRDFGCEIEGDRVRFPDVVVEEVLARIAEAKARRGVTEPRHGAEIHYAASGQALYCCDLQTDELRPATTKDLADFSRVVDSIPRLERAHPTFIPQDVPTGSCDVHAFATIMLNSARPHRVSVYSEKMLPYFMELQAVADGSLDAVKRDPIFAAKCWFNSPFMMTNENIRIAMKARELLGQPFTISTMPVAGVATPVTLAGALVQMTAEVLACNAVTLAIDDRLAGYCAGPLTFDMRAGVHTQTGPDAALILLGASQMGAYLFGGSYQTGSGPTTAAKAPGAQAMMEKALHTMWAVLGGTRSLGSLGVLAFADVGSVVQLLLDVEMMTYLERLLEGISVDEERLAEALICEVAPEGARFLETEHTARFYRDELWLPELLDRRVPMAWARDPATMVDNARRKAHRLVETAPNRCPLSESQKREVRRIVAAADREVERTTRSLRS
ncbi:MAG: trimethylamine methyltransferase family protein [Armatimonadota bacterium]